MVRRVEACAPDTTYSPHLVANILRLLHLAATDRSTSPEASASIRRLALDNAPSMCEQRRVVFEAMKKCGYRGNEALQRAIDSGNSTTGSMASVFRPIALGSARVAATTQDIAAMARAELTPEVAKKLDDSLLRLTYGVLAFDIFSTDAVAHVLIPLVPDQDRETCVALVLDSARQRAVLRERMLKSFDMERSKFIERGLVRDEAASDRFWKSLLGYLKTSRIGAEQMLSQVAAIARANPKWDEAEFDAARREWRSAVRQRLQEVAITGGASHVLPYPRMETIVQGALEE